MDDLEFKLELMDERKLVRQEVYEEFKMDIDSFRAAGLIFTNYVENVCKNIVVYLEKNEKRRGLKRDRILKILKQNNVIDKEVEDDLKSVFDIRDEFGHTM